MQVHLPGGLPRLRDNSKALEEDVPQLQNLKNFSLSRVLQFFPLHFLQLLMDNTRWFPWVEEAQPPLGYKTCAKVEKGGEHSSSVLCEHLSPRLVSRTRSQKRMRAAPAYSNWMLRMLATEGCFLLPRSQCHILVSQPH